MIKEILAYIPVAWFPAYILLFGSMNLKRNFLKPAFIES